MKKNKYLLLFLSVLVIQMFSGCQEDDTVVTSTAPQFSEINNEISSLPGLTVNFSAQIEDPAGIKSVRIIYEPWFLDKTITKDSLPESYELSYDFKVPDNADTSTAHTVQIIAENAGRVATNQNIVVSLDADFEAPSIVVNNPSNNATIQIGEGDEIIFDVNLSDNKSLSTFSIESDLLTETIDLSGTSAKYSRNLDISEPAVYEFTLTVTDDSGNSNSSDLVVNVVEDLNFLNMFLADDAGEVTFENSLSGYPYSTNSSTIAGEEGYVFRVKYFAPRDNTGVYFVAQKTGFSPFSFGGHSENSGELIIGSDNNINPILLDKKGYYDLTMDLRDLSYTVTPITATAPGNIGSGFTGVYVTGSGVTVGGTAITRFNPSASSAPLSVDSEFEFRYSAELVFNAESGAFIFIGNQSNYSIFWRVNNSDIELASNLVPQGGNNCGFAVQYEGTYKVSVDIFLNTFVITKVD